MASLLISTPALKSFGFGIFTKRGTGMRQLNKHTLGILLSAVLVSQSGVADTHMPKDSETKSLTSSLALNNDDEKCKLIVAQNDQAMQSIDLLLDSPCYWVTTEDTSQTEPLTYSYPDLNIEAVALIAGGELDWPDEKKTYNKLPIDQQCSQFLQGVIISNNEVLAVDTQMEAPHCQGLSVDEKVFQQVTESEDRYASTPPSLNTDIAASETTTENKPSEKQLSIAEETEKPTEDDSLLGSIQKTIKKLFSSDD